MTLAPPMRALPTWPGILALTLLMFCSPIWPADNTTSPSREAMLPVLTVTAMDETVEKSYRRMVRGMDLFDSLRALAPQAQLRYRLLPRRRDTDMQRVTLAIFSDSLTLLVPVENGTFELERNALALAENAVVAPDRRVGSLTWRTDIRTPGLPPGTRRLGDLRLECRVGMEAGLVSDDLPIIGAIARLIAGGGSYCDSDQNLYLYFAERPLFGVTLVWGGRRESLPTDRLYAGITNGSTSRNSLGYCDCELLLDRAYFLPLGDRRWPDDTLLEFEYMEDEKKAPAAAAVKDITADQIPQAVQP